ncbi:MAG: SNF2-related protein, partial [Armatimonadetes bacterium]|nr:SNF2-related protein [Armatimonadota bacterium]
MLVTPLLGRDKSQTDWERNKSALYPVLSKYQQDGYRRALQIAEQWGGCLVCDGVGLGKTFIGMMLLENALFHKKKVLLIVPLSGRISVWERNIDIYLKPKYPLAHIEQVTILNHTDFGRDGTIPQKYFEYYRDYYDVVIVDEAHHFRHPYRTRSLKLMEIAKGKQVFLLTATSINNTLV